jgi:hypothetical protein
MNGSNLSLKQYSDCLKSAFACAEERTAVFGWPEIEENHLRVIEHRVTVAFHEQVHKALLRQADFLD